MVVGGRVAVRTGVAVAGGLVGTAVAGTGVSVNTGTAVATTGRGVGVLVAATAVGTAVGTVVGVSVTSGSFTWRRHSDTALSVALVKVTLTRYSSSRPGCCAMVSAFKESVSGCPC